MQPAEPEDLQLKRPFAEPFPINTGDAPTPPAPSVPAPTSMESVQLDLSGLTADDVEKAFPPQTQEQEQALRMAVAQIVLEVQRNWDIARQTAVLIAGAQSIARLIGFALKP